MVLCIKWSLLLTLTTPIIIYCSALTNQGVNSRKRDGDFSCFCSPGSFEASSFEIYAATDICSSKKLGISEISNVFKSKTSVRLKTCVPCDPSCKECVGPGEESCLACADEYLSIEIPSSIDEEFLEVEQLLAPLPDSDGDDSTESESSGDGPLKSTKVVHCVSLCPPGYNVSDKNKSCQPNSLKKFNLTLTTIPLIESDVDEPTPPGYYAIPPLVILVVCVILIIAYLRKRNRESNALWNNDPVVVVRKGSSAESKTFLSINHKHLHQHDYRPANVYTDRPLPHHPPLHRGHHGGSTTSSCWSTNDDDQDGIYETPESRRYHTHRAPIMNKSHHSNHSSIAKSKSLDDCRHHNKQTEKQRPSKRRSGSLESNDLPQPIKKPGGHHVVYRNSSDPMEVPNHHAPPAPIRHVAINTKRRINSDHIYVNVDDSA